MKIKDIIKASSMLLGRRDITAYLESQTEGTGEDTLSDINLMTGLTNLVINELSSTYIPLVKSERHSTIDGKIYYSRFSETVLKIKEIIDDNGNEVLYKEYPLFVQVMDNSVTVIYEYMPHNYGLEDTIGYTEKEVQARVLAYGLCAEFSISNGRFDEAVTWHKRYVDSLKEICIPENSYVKQRRFI